MPSEAHSSYLAVGAVCNGARDDILGEALAVEVSHCLRRGAARSHDAAGSYRLALESGDSLVGIVLRDARFGETRANEGIPRTATRE